MKISGDSFCLYPEVVDPSSFVRTLANNELNSFILCKGNTEGDGKWAAAYGSLIIDGLLQRYKDKIFSYNKKPSSLGRLELETLLRTAIQQCSKEIYYAAKSQKKEKLFSGISIDVLLITKDYAFLAHAGENEAVFVRNGQVKKIIKNTPDSPNSTFDFNLSIDDADFSKRDSAANLAGLLPTIQINVQPFPIVDGDVFLLFTSEFANLTESRIESPSKLLLQAIKDGDSRQIFQVLLSQTGKTISEAAAVAVKIDRNKSSGTAFTDETLKQHFDILKNIAIFSHLKNDEESLNRIYSLTHKKVYKKGDHIMKEGAESDEMFIILSGTVHGYRKGKLVYKVKAGNVTGEIGVFNQEPRHFTVIAPEEVSILVIDGKQLFSLMRENKQLGLQLYAGVVQELSLKVKVALEVVNE
jgi:serine/threonine protein phosphatase PrpC